MNKVLFLIGVSIAMVNFVAAEQQQAPSIQELQQTLVNKIKSELIYVQGGEYSMGDFGQVKGEGNLEFWQNSKPLHLVKVDSFSMGSNKVTLQDYQVYLQSQGRAKNEFNYSKFIISDSIWERDNRWQWHEVYLPYQDEIEGELPVFLYWQDANTYCQWLGELTGLPFDLPTEAQWEYAARNRGQNIEYATDNGKLEEGRNVPTKSELESYAYMHNYSVNYLWILKGKTFQKLKQYPPTALGFYDMTYQGWEWMKDYYAERYYQYSPTDNPQGEKVPTIWRSVRGMDSRKSMNGLSSHLFNDMKITEYGKTFTREKQQQEYRFFPLGYTVRCVVNSPEKIN